MASEYQLLKFSQLTLAHSSRLLIYAKEGKERARKLRPEFAAVYVSQDVKECHKHILKYNSSLEFAGVDVVILDMDLQSLKLIDYINKRCTDPSTQHLPLISIIAIVPNTSKIQKLQQQQQQQQQSQQDIKKVEGVSDVVLLPNDASAVVSDNETTDEVLQLQSQQQQQQQQSEDSSSTVMDWEASIAAVGGVSATVGSDVSTRGLLYIILDVLQRRRSVETTFQGLKVVNRTIAKYPYMPIFSKHEDGGDDGKSDEDDDQRSLDRGDSKAVGDEDAESLSLESVKDLDDWTDTSSMLPSFVKEKRRVLMDMRSARRSGTTVSSGTGSKRGEDASERDERRSFMKSSQSGDVESPRRSFAEIKERHRVDTIILGRIRRADSGNGEVEDDESIKSMDDGEFSETRNKVDINASKSHLDKQKRIMGTLKPLQARNTQQEGCAVLLDAAHRPHWGGTSSGVHADDDDLEGKTQAGNGSPSSKGVSLHAFINKPHPPTNVAHTVVGLDKKVATTHWSVLKAKAYSQDSDKPDLEKMKSSSSFTLGASRGGVEILRTSTFDSFSVGNASLQENQLKHSYDSTQPPEGFISQSQEQSITAFSIIQDTPVSQSASPVQGKRGAKKLMPDAKAMDFATRMIKRLARDSPPDVLLNSMIEVDLSRSKVTIGERDVLRQGLKLEQEGELEHAISCYTRAGQHSKEMHLSKIFLGSLHFRMGKFMAALKYFTDAITFLESFRTTAIFNPDETFVAIYNRGITNFRVGDDEQGVQDLEKAVELMPRNLQAKEALALALRRIGQYKESIEHSISNKVLRSEAKAIAHMQRKKSRPATSSRPASRAKTTTSFPKDDADSEVGGSKRRGSNASYISAASHSTNNSIARLESQITTRPQPLFQGVREEDSVTTVETPLPSIHVALETFGGRSMKDMKALVKKHHDRETGTSVNSGDALRSFKVINGFAQNLFEGLFIKPSALQEALIQPPEVRTSAQLQTIGSALRLFPFLWAVPDNVIMSLANCVEYRAVVNKGQLYFQNAPSDAVCFLLRGHMQMRLETPLGIGASSLSYLTVGEVEPFDSIGYIDILFRDPNSPLMRHLLDFVNAKEATHQEETTIPTATDDDDREHKKGSPAHLQTTLPPTAGGKGMSPILGFGAEAPQDPLLVDGKTRNISKGLLALDMDDDHSDANRSTELDDDDLPRALRRGMFMTYTMTSQCELLLVPEFDFKRLLYPYACADLEKRISIIMASGVFKGWKRDDIIRLTRMGHVRTFRSGKVILQQGQKPMFLYLIMKGMCRSYKRKNTTEIISKRLEEAKERAERHDLKYTYHHKLRRVLRPGKVQIDPAAPATVNKEILKRGQHLTETEARRYELGLEIARLEAQLLKAQQQEAKEQSEEVSLDEEAPSITAKLVEISTLSWPMLFGEACILDPEHGVSRGTIVSDTTCDVFMIHKTQIQTFKVESELLERVACRAVRYPADDDLAASIARKGKWTDYKSELMKGISKARWPSRENDREPFHVT